ncbi:MAG: ABC transporter permease [Nevskiaceae bacterium]
MSQPAWLTVLAKEARENMRDRRTLASALVFGPLMFPAILVVVLTLVGGRISGDLEKPLELPVVGAEHAPSLVAHLRQQSVHVLPAPADPREAVLRKQAEVVLVIPPGYAEAWRDGRPAPVELHFDRTHDRAQTTLRRVRALLDQYGASIGALRLMARGIDPAVTRALAVDERDAAGVDPMLAMLIAFFPYGLMFAAFFGGMYLAIDSTSGERERLTLEPLLLNPVSRRQLVLGKLGATVLFSTVSLALCVAAMSVGLTLVPQLPGGLELSLPPAKAAQIFLIALPVVLLAAASQMLIASFTRSYREAQTYVQFFQFIPMVPSLVQILSPVEATPGVLLTPVLGQSVLISLIGRGRPLELAQVALSWGGTLVAGALFAAAVVWFYRREKLFS